MRGCPLFKPDPPRLSSRLAFDVHFVEHLCIGRAVLPGFGRIPFVLLHARPIRPHQLRPFLQNVGIAFLLPEFLVVMAPQEVEQQECLAEHTDSFPRLTSHASRLQMYGL